jgi:hypothetical protein
VVVEAFLVEEGIFLRFICSDILCLLALLGLTVAIVSK